MITKLISGGQTGADRGGLDGAIHFNIPHGGWCPKGRKAEDVFIPAKYHLKEMPTDEYLACPKANVVDSDATVIFTYEPLSGGSLKSATYAHHLEKSYFDVNLELTPRRKAVEEIVRWLAGDAEFNDYDEDLAKPPPLACVLNVAGSRESHAPGIQEVVFHLMVDVLVQIHPACKHYDQITIHPFHGMLKIGLPVRSPFNVPKNWDQLEFTSDETIRHCSVCNQTVRMALMGICTL